MSAIYYVAAWTECGFLLTCSHLHERVHEATSCIPCAGGYVVAVENGAMRSLTAEEESEFQRVHYAPHTDNLVAPEETVADDPRYTVMIRIRVGGRWIWTTWMCYATYRKLRHTHETPTKLCVFDPPNMWHYGSRPKPLLHSL